MARSGRSFHLHQLQNSLIRATTPPHTHTHTHTNLYATQPNILIDSWLEPINVYSQWLYVYRHIIWVCDSNYRGFSVSNSITGWLDYSRNSVKGCPSLRVSDSETVDHGSQRIKETVPSKRFLGSCPDLSGVKKGYLIFTSLLSEKPNWLSISGCRYWSSAEILACLIILQ